MAEVVETNLIRLIAPNETAQMAIGKNVDEMRQDLGYEDAPPLEMLLINMIVLAWLRYQFAEYHLSLLEHHEVDSITIALWEKRLNAAQVRYLRACETLAKTKKLSLKNPRL